MLYGQLQNDLPMPGLDPKHADLRLDILNRLEASMEGTHYRIKAQGKVFEGNMGHIINEVGFLTQETAELDDLVEVEFSGGEIEHVYNFLMSRKVSSAHRFLKIFCPLKRKLKNIGG